jgi:hypothetical protein
MGATTRGFAMLRAAQKNVFDGDATTWKMMAKYRHATTWGPNPSKD